MMIRKFFLGICITLITGSILFAQTDDEDKKSAAVGNQAPERALTEKEIRAMMEENAKEEVAVEQTAVSPAETKTEPKVQSESDLIKEQLKKEMAEAVAASLKTAENKTEKEKETTVAKSQKKEEAVQMTEKETEKTAQKEIAESETTPPASVGSTLHRAAMADPMKAKAAETAAKTDDSIKVKTTSIPVETPEIAKPVESIPGAPPVKQPQIIKVELVDLNAKKSETKTETEKPEEIAKTEADTDGGIPGEKDYDKGIKEYTDSNYAVAFVYFKSAAESGYSAAMYNLGVMYASGLGTEKNEDEALKWFTKAAEKGNVQAQAMLKSIQQAKKDYMESFDW